VFVPSTAPKVKKEGILRLGARVIDSEPDYDAAMVAARRLALETGATFINPCLGDALLAGQGTVGLEIIEQLPDVRTIVVPVGGGGLLGGIAAIVRHEAPQVRMIGAQSENTAAMSRSIAAGELVEISSVPTLADGLAGQIDEEALAIGQFALDDIIALSEDQIAEAIAWVSRNEKRKVEGAGAVALGAVLHKRIHDLRFPAVVVLSGGNIDDSVHQQLLSRFA
jgi:threonine dehydratase